MPYLPKFIRMKAWQWHGALERRQHKLNYLFWEATLACNLACRHCGSSCTPKQSRKDELTTQEVIDTFRTIAEDFDAKKIMVAITGGEPLLRDDLFEITKEMRVLGFPWGMVTNGLLVKSKTPAKCLETGMTSVTISLDGMKKTHEWLRGRNSFEPAKKATRLFRKAGGTHLVQITSTIHSRNLEDLPEMYKLVKELGVNEWRLLLIDPIGRAADKPDMELSAGQFREMMDFIKEHRAKDDEMSITFGDEGFLGHRYEGEVRDSFFRCWAGVNIGGIMYDGAIGSCPNIGRRYLQGNVREERFSEVWKYKYKEFRDRSWMKKGMCEKCRVWKHCRSNGFHLWSDERCEPMRCHYKMLFE